jgi:hypothetical protein
MEQAFSYLRESYHQLKGQSFFSDRLSYVTPRSNWCGITVLNAHAPTEDKSDDTKDSFYGGLEIVLD